MRMTVYQWLCVLGIPSMIAGLLTFVKLQIKQNRAIKLGIQALLRDRLLQAFRYYAGRGWADYDDKRNVENLFRQYEALGENGVMQDMYASFRKLPEKND